VQQPPQILDGQAEAAADAQKSAPQFSTAKAVDAHPSNSRSISTRIGGWIANLFSWYRY
jgi:hypothetical protein